MYFLIPPQGKAESGLRQVDRHFLKELGFDIVEYSVFPDDESEIVPAVRRCCDDLHVNLLITTGGTGISPRTRPRRRSTDL